MLELIGGNVGPCCRKDEGLIEAPVLPLSCTVIFMNALVGGTVGAWCKRGIASVGANTLQIFSFTGLFMKWVMHCRKV